MPDGKGKLKPPELLDRGIYPASRSELAEQLRSIGNNSREGESHEDQY